MRRGPGVRSGSRRLQRLRRITATPGPDPSSWRAAFDARAGATGWVEFMCAMTGHPAAHQVVGEQLEQERRFFRVEVGGRGLADAESVLELGDERLDACAVVVKARELVEVAVPIARDVDVDRVVEVVPQSRSATLQAGATDGGRGVLIDVSRLAEGKAAQPRVRSRGADVLCHPPCC